jgi:two-component system, sensor histidine kinase and response regulator
MSTVLIVDDEPDVREALQEFLEDEGCQVETVADGAEALKYLERDELPCVVILDLIMPIVSGNEVYNRIQAHPRLSRLPVVVSTSDPSRAPAGAVVVRKPVDLTRLLGFIRQHCVCR